MPASKANHSDPPTVESLLLRARELWSKDFSQAVTLADQAYALAEQEKDVIHMAGALNAKAVCNWYVGDYNSAINFGLNAMRTLEDDASVEATRTRISIISNLGLNYYMVDDYENALDCYIQSLYIALEHGSSESVVTFLNNIGGAFWTLRDNFEPALKKAINKTFVTGVVYGDHVSLDMRMIVNRLLHLDRQEDIGGILIDLYTHFIETDQSSLEAKANLLLNIGLLHQESERYQEALNSMHAALKFMEEHDMEMLYPLAHYNIGVALQTMKDLPSALESLQAALDCSLSLGETHHQFNIVQRMAEVYEQMNEPLKALEAMKRAFKLHQQNMTEQNSEKIAKLHLRYESEKRMRESKLAQQKAEIYRLRNVELEKMVHERTKQVLKMEKLYEVGKYAASIVHNLNNPLTTLLGSLEFMSDRLDELPDEIRFIYQLLQSSSENMKKMIQSITRNVRSSLSEQDCPLDINTIAETAIDFRRFDASNAKSLEIETDLEENLPKIQGQEIHFLQIFDNLLRNAIDAMANSPEKILSVVTRRVGEGVEISVIDTGEGITPSDLNRIFEIDFTTKEAGKGTGLGLSITKQMVESYRGTIKVESEPGAGATFTIWLPIDEKCED